VDFDLTDEETAVIEAARQVAAAADPWDALAAGGWLDLLAGDGEESSPGLGYLGLVAEELGAGGVSVALIGTGAVWPTLFGASAGGRRVGVVDGPDGLGEDGAGAEVVVVLGDGGAEAFESFTAEAVGGLDGDRLARVEVAGEPVARTAGPALVAEARRRAAAVAASEMAGALRRISEMTTSYVAERQQFGRPIAAFQVVAHGAARLATLAEAAIWSARLACRAPEAEHTHAAKGWVSHTSQEAAALAHQLHGAIGFTEEYGLQRLTKRLRTLRFAWGDDRSHHLALGRLRAGSN
jgi:alkylation response protein AidB-like acyl-CoA dehydrogenase